MSTNDKPSTGIFIKPIGLLIIITASIFASSVLVDFFLSMFPRSSPQNFTLSAAVLLTVILFPVIYYLVFAPLKSYIRELEHSEEALQVSEAKYRSLVESTDDSVYLVNRNYEYLFMNAKHRSRMGFFGDEYLGRAFSEFHSAEATRVFAEEVKKVLETRGSFQHEHRSERDGKYFLRTLSPVKGPNGAIVSVSIVSKNVTGLKQADAAKHS
jgi:PAS domain S-box-containing protein